MKSIISTLFLSLFLVVGFGQKRPDQFTEETSPTDANFEVYSQKNGQVRRASLGNLKKYFTPDVNTTDITYIPATTGNTLNLMEFVKNAGDSIYYIDSSGDAFLLRDPNASGGGSTELADGVTIIGDGTTGNELRADTTNKIATKADLSNKIDRNTITRTFYDVDSSYVFTVNDNYENDVLISVDTILRQCDGCDVGQDIQYNKIETVPDYDSLRNIDKTRYEHDVINVADFTYIGPDGFTYTTLGGVFKWTGNASLENGGTLIAGWERDWNHIRTIPDWWECGGRDYLGRDFVSKNVSVSVQGELAGIYDDSDRIRSAQLLDGLYNIELVPNRTYIITRDVQ